MRKKLMTQTMLMTVNIRSLLMTKVCEKSEWRLKERKQRENKEKNVLQEIMYQQGYIIKYTAKIKTNSKLK